MRSFCNKYRNGVWRNQKGIYIINNESSTSGMAWDSIVFSRNKLFSNSGSVNHEN